MEIQAAPLADFLKTQKELKELIIYQNNIKDDLVAEIIKSLKETDIEILDLSDNYIKTQSIEQLSLLMKEKNLKVLKISDCNIDPEISDIF